MAKTEKPIDLDQPIFQRDAYVHNKSMLFRVMGLESDVDSKVYVRLENAHGEWNDKLSIYKHTELRMSVERASGHLIIAKAAPPDAQPERDTEVCRPAKASA